MTDKEQQLISDFKATFNTDAGANVLRFLSRFCLENQQSYVPQSERQTCFNEGARSVILTIRNKLAATGEPRQQNVNEGIQE
jgi:hypothetical protein